MPLVLKSTFKFRILTPTAEATKAKPASEAVNVASSPTTSSASEIVVQPHHGGGGDVSKPETSSSFSSMTSTASKNQPQPLPKPNNKGGSSSSSTFLPKIQIGSFNESTTNYRNIIKEL